MSQHTAHTVFDFGGESAAKSLDLSAAARDALEKADAELAQTHDVLREMAEQLAGMEREGNAWKLLAWSFAATTVVLVIAVVVLAVG